METSGPARSVPHPLTSAEQLTGLSVRKLVRMALNRLQTYLMCMRAGADIVSFKNGKVVRLLKVPRNVIEALETDPATMKLIQENEIIVLLVKNNDPGKPIQVIPWNKPKGPMNSR
jgi:hypothetical protein